MLISVNNTEQGVCFTLGGRVTIEDIAELLHLLRGNMHSKVSIDLEKVVALDRTAVTVLGVISRSTMRCGGDLFVNNVGRKDLGSLITYL